MKTSRETLADIISSARDYEMVSKALSSVIDLLIDENAKIDTSQVDNLLYEQNQKHGVISDQSLRIRRAGRLIAGQIKELVLASAKEQISSSGSFRLPGDNDGDYIFNDSIIEKYGVADDAYLKDEWDRYGSFYVEILGDLKELFDRHSCSGISMRVFFQGDLGSDFIEITELSDVDNAFMNIDICDYGGASIVNMETLAEELAENRSVFLQSNAS